MRTALALNPRARQGDLPPDEIVQRLSQQGVTADLLSVPNGDLAAAVQKAITAGYDAIIAGGGDGTLSIIAHQLAATPIKLGILPLGTANDFARSLSIPHDLDQACAVIAAGHTVRVDVGVVNGRRFLNVASIGLPAKVSAAITPQLKKRLGVLAYPVAAVQALTHQRPFGAKLTVDGRVHRVRWVMQLAVGSGRHYGGGMTLTDIAQPTDGHLHVHVITARNLGALLWTLRHLRSGRYAPDHNALRFSAQHVRVETRRRHRINADGELVGHTPLDVTVLPHALEVFAPLPPGAGI